MISDGYTIRLAQVPDLRQIAELEQTLFSRPWTEQGFLDALCNPAAEIWVAKAGNEDLCGYLCMYVALDEGEITNVAVHPDFRNRGIGSALMRNAQRFAVEKSVHRIVLEARVSNQNAVSVYQDCGFERLGIRKDFYEMPREDAVIMAWENKEC